MDINSVTYHSGCVEVPRGGLLGWIIDALFGKRVVYVGAPVYVAVTSRGVFSSPDGITWTYRKLPDPKP